MAEWKNPIPGVEPFNANIMRVILASVEEWSGTAGGSGITTTLLYGTSNPTGATGANGDFYINSSTWKIFGPKTAGAWPAGVDMIGATGPTGSTGATGPTGPMGGTYNVDGGDPSSIYGGILPLDAGGVI